MSSYCNLIRQKAFELLKIVILPLLVFLAIGANQSILGQSQKEYVFYNGKIFTSNHKKPYAEAVAIRGDKIIAVGKKNKILKVTSDNAEMIDLNGKTLLPGFIDSHIHAVGGGQALIAAHLDDKYISNDSLKNFADASRKNGRAMFGDVMMITGLNMKHWEEPALFSKLFNTGVYETVPLYLRSADGHTAWLNKAMLSKMMINKDFISSLPANEKIYYGQNPDQTLNGVISEKPVFDLYTYIQSQALEKNVEAGSAAIKHLNSLGFTALLDPRYQDPSPVFKALSDKGELTAHVGVCIKVDPNDEPKKQIEYIQSLQKKYANSPGLSIMGVKIFADGVPEFPTQTAAMSKPYINSGMNGDLLFNPESFLELIKEVDKAGMSIQVHAIGDKTVTEVLNGFEKMRKANGKSNIKHTMIHLQFVNPTDHKRFKKLGVVASFSFLWAHADTVYTNLVKPYIDPEIYSWQYPINSMRKAGTIIAAGSDWPVSSPNPFEAIYVGEMRMNETELVLDEKERMPRLELFYAYTINAAKAMNMENKIGSIEAGKQADLILIDRDVTTVTAKELREAKIIWTMLGGKKVFERIEK